MKLSKKSIFCTAVCLTLLPILTACSQNNEIKDDSSNTQETKIVDSNYNANTSSTYELSNNTQELEKRIEEILAYNSFKCSSEGIKDDEGNTLFPSQKIRAFSEPTGVTTLSIFKQPVKEPNMMFKMITISRSDWKINHVTKKHKMDNMILVSVELTRKINQAKAFVPKDIKDNLSPDEISVVDEALQKLVNDNINTTTTETMLLLIPQNEKYLTGSDLVIITDEDGERLSCNAINMKNLPNLNLQHYKFDKLSEETLIEYFPLLDE